MTRIISIFSLWTLLLSSGSSFAQRSRIDEIFSGGDTTAIMDSLMRDFNAYLDSLIKPESFFNISAGIGTGFFSFEDNATLDYQVKNKTIFSPELSYFHKSGLGLTLTSYMLREGSKLSSYQYAVIPTYHFLKRDKFSTGISYTRFYNKENLSFYTTPIQNQVYAFFNLKKWWLVPGVAVSYGWGNKTEFESREVDVYLKRLKSSHKKVIMIQRDEFVRDFSSFFSVRHSFVFSDALLTKDMLTIRPVLLVSAGTQNVGFNTTFSSSTINNSYFLPFNSNITDVRGLDFQSSTIILQVDYSLGKYYIIPQLMMDYYLHLADKRFNTIGSVTLGVNF